MSSAPTISPEERDALYSQAMDLLSGIGSTDREIDPRFSDDLRHLLETLGDIQPANRVELTMPPADLRRVVTDVRDQLPPDPGAERRSGRTRFVARACASILRQLDGQQE